MSNHNRPQNIKLEQLYEDFTKLVNSKIKLMLKKTEEKEKGRQTSIQEKYLDFAKETISKLTLSVNSSSVSFEVDESELKILITVSFPTLEGINTMSRDWKTLDELTEIEIKKYISECLMGV